MYHKRENVYFTSLHCYPKITDWERIYIQYTTPPDSSIRSAIPFLTIPLMPFLHSIPSATFQSQVTRKGDRHFLQQSLIWVEWLVRIQDARVIYSMMVEHDRAVLMIEQIDQIVDALLDHNLIEGHLWSRLIEQTTVEKNSIMIWPCPSLVPRES